MYTPTEKIFSISHHKLSSLISVFLLSPHHRKPKGKYSLSAMLNPKLERRDNIENKRKQRYI